MMMMRVDFCSTLPSPFPVDPGIDDEDEGDSAKVASRTAALLLRYDDSICVPLPLPDFEDDDAPTKPRHLFGLEARTRREWIPLFEGPSSRRQKDRAQKSGKRLPCCSFDHASGRATAPWRQ